MDDSKINIQQVIDPQLKENYIAIHAQSESQAQSLAQQISPCLSRSQENIALKVDDQYFIVHTKDILYLEVNQGILTITTSNKKYQSRQSLSSLADKLNSQDFIRISKYAMVRLQAIERLEMAFSGNMYAYLSTGQQVNVSRRFVSQVKNRLGIWKESHHEKHCLCYLSKRLPSYHYLGGHGRYLHQGLDLCLYAGLSHVLRCCNRRDLGHLWVQLLAPLSQGQHPLYRLFISLPPNGLCQPLVSTHWTSPSKRHCLLRPHLLCHLGLLLLLQPP